jgi:hypothetical protein
LIPTKSRVSLTKSPRKGVSGFLSHQIRDQRLKTDPWASARTRTWARTDQWARAISDRVGRQTDWSGPVPGAQVTNRWVRTQGARSRSGIPRSRLCDPDQTVKINTREGLTAGGGAAPSRGGEVAGVGAGACYDSSGVTGVGQN